MADGVESLGGWRIAAAFALGAMLAGCATRQAAPTVAPSPAPSAPVSVRGVASWYGPGFDGHLTSSGEIYNQDDLTAATTLFPLESRVMVTNLDNGRSVEVRINDRGPYVKGRAIDLSHKAATLLAMVNPGTAPVRIDLISAPGPFVLGHQRYFVQVGSFSEEANAQRLSRRLAAHFSDVEVDPISAGNREYYRVRMGAFADRDAARERAAAASRLGLPIIITSE
jgi:peptidoglycan lytic transglycosylase